jgi:hypothetical protein
MEHKFGRNDGVPNGSWELVSLVGGSGSFLTSAKTVRIKAGGDAADTSAGIGARSITVLGLDETLAEVQEDIATSGANVSLPTIASFWRVYRAYISDNGVGTYGAANTDDIIIEDSGGANEMIKIAADEGQSQHGAYAVPIGKTGYLLSVQLTADAGKAADFRLFTRENLTDVSAPMSPRRLRLFWDGILGHIDADTSRAPSIMLPALTDIWIEARGGGGGTEVSVDFEILLVDDPDPDIRQI